MKLWKWLSSRRSVEIEKIDVSDNDNIDANLESAQTKLDATKQQLPELAKAVASARRIKYKVDSFTRAMDDGMLGRKSHG